MAEGAWVALGAAIGAAGPVITAIVNAWFSRSKPDYFDKRAMRILKKMLSASGAKWLPISALSHAVGLSRDETRQLLILIGARGHESGSNAWGLTSRVGFVAENTPPED